MCLSKRCPHLLTAVIGEEENEFIYMIIHLGFVMIEMENMAPNESDLFWSVTFSLHCPPQCTGGRPGGRIWPVPWMPALSLGRESEDSIHVLEWVPVAPRSHLLSLAVLINYFT